jgi:2-C-methyl-D-erythritol 4-phosphate cytidylyltransferase
MSTSWPEPSPPNVGVIVVAAGRGLRAGGEVPKQFREIAGTPAVLRALRPFALHRAVRQLVVVLPKAMAQRPPSWLAPLISVRLSVVEGGAERIDSVAAGLAALPDDCQVAVVHDGARPFPDPAVIDAVIDAARRGQSAIAAVPVTDTLKEATVDQGTGELRIVRTVSRHGLWRAQTPQAFPIRALRRGLAAARDTGMTTTDDAALVEAIGEPILLVPDRPTNLKLTTEADFALAEAIGRMLR